VSVLDHYLQQRPTARNMLPLVGIACLSVAAKFLEVHAPSHQSLARLSANSFTPQQVAIWEAKVLNTVGFNIHRLPTSWHFVDLHSRANGCDQLMMHMIHYILELALLWYGMIRHRPSHLSAAAVCLCNQLLRHGDMPSWPPAMVSYTGYTSEDLARCIEELREMLRNVERFDRCHMRSRFSSSDRDSVALLVSMALG